MAILQHCPAPGCEGDVRYVAPHLSRGGELRGACGGCGRRFRLVRGQPAEVSRTRRRRPSLRSSSAGTVGPADGAAG